MKDKVAGRELLSVLLIFFAFMNITWIYVMSLVRPAGRPFCVAKTLTLDIYYGLRRSSLIMGVHSGCPVCSIIAASLVAVETDV